MERNGKTVLLLRTERNGTIKKGTRTEQEFLLCNVLENIINEINSPGQEFLLCNVLENIINEINSPEQEFLLCNVLENIRIKSTHRGKNSYCECT